MQLSHAYFYIRFTNFIANENNDKALEFKSMSEMNLENELINDIKSLNVEKINRIKEDLFDKVYGAGSSKQLLSYYIYILYLILKTYL